MSHTPVFDATLADSAPDIWQASHVFPRPTPEPHISFIRERGAWERAFEQVYRVTLGPKRRDNSVRRLV